MDYYYVIVSTVFIVLLILTLSYYGVVMQQTANKNNAYPPKPPSNCPDYWTSASDGSCNIPPYSSKNTGNIYDITDPTKPTIVLSNTPGYNSNGPTINFSEPGWTSGGVDPVCNQKNWANSKNILWDGVSNYNSC
jgi:hypothetical protein